MRASALLLFLPALALAACVTEVSHPTKTKAEMQVDIDRCIDQAVEGRPAGLSIDPLGELEDTYVCLEKLGYSRGKATRDEVATRTAQRPPRRVEPEGEAKPAEPCRVPCNKPDGR